MMSDEKDWQHKAGLKIEQVCDLLGIGRSLAWELVRTGELESFQIRSARRIKPESVLRLIEGNAVTETREAA